MNYANLLPYAKSQRQKEIIEEVINTKNFNKAAKKLGINVSNVSRCINRLKKYKAEYDVRPEYKTSTELPTPFIPDRVTTAYDKDGNVDRQWVKVKTDKQAQIEAINEWIDSLVLPAYSPVELAPVNYLDCMAVYPLGDPHIGVVSYINETGESWNLLKQRDTFTGIFDRAIQAAPACKEAVIVNLGDYHHFDNAAGVTTRSGHHLDKDSNYFEMIDIGMEIMLHMIQSALHRHSNVRVINAIGNHDDVSTQFMTVALDRIFRDNPRVTIDKHCQPFHFIEFGRNLLGVHHGHTVKADKLPLVMASDVPELWGKTQFRLWLTGHIHHDTEKEYAGCKVRSFRTLAAKDAYATWGGYRSDRDTKVLLFHPEFGLIEEHTINLVQHR